jgi:hypothetical protein
LAGILDGMLQSVIRKEMKSRVDEVLAAGRQWDNTAKALTQAIQHLAELAEQGKLDPAAVNASVKCAQILRQPTIRLSKAFENYLQTLCKISSNL